MFGVETDRWKKSRAGSITVEAALIVPLLLTYFLALYTIVRLAVCEAGLRSAVSQSVHQLAVNAYPLRLLIDSYVDRELLDKLQEWHDEYQETKEGAEQWIEDYGALIPGMVRNILEEMIKQSGQIEKGITAPIRQAVKPIVAHYLPRHMDASNLTVTGIQYNLFINRGDPYVTLEATYDVPVRLPFFTRSVTLRASATEHVWTSSR